MMLRRRRMTTTTDHENTSTKSNEDLHAVMREAARRVESDEMMRDTMDGTHAVVRSAYAARVTQKGSA